MGGGGGLYAGQRTFTFFETNDKQQFPGACLQNNRDFQGVHAFENKCGVCGHPYRGGAGGGEVAPNKRSFANAWLYIPAYAALCTLVGAPHGGFLRRVNAVSGEMKRNLVGFNATAFSGKNNTECSVGISPPPPHLRECVFL